MTQTRQPAGIPTGGQFAAGSQGRATVALDEGTLAKHFGTRAYEPEPGPALTPQPTGRQGIWTVDPAPSHTRVDQRQRNLTAAVVTRDFDGHPGEPGTPLHTARQLAERSQSMTMLTNDPFGNVQAIEGRAATAVDGTLCVQLKGTRSGGFPIDGPNAMPLLSVVPGYGGQASVAAEYQRRKDLVPEVEPVTFDGIPEYDWREEPPSAIAAAFLVDAPDVTGDGPVRGAMFFATDIQAEDGIVNGYHWFPEGSGLTPEHGSMYVADIEKHGGRIKGYKPGALSFGDLLNKKIPRSRIEAYRAVQGQTYYDE